MESITINFNFGGAVEEKECFSAWECDIMSIHNSHNPNLVERINKVFREEKHLEDLATFLYALAQRDRKEIEDKLGVVIKNRQMAFDYAEEILMRVCDNYDLMQMIGFIRMD